MFAPGECARLQFFAAMQRVWNPFPIRLILVALVGVLGWPQEASAQNNPRDQEGTHHTETAIQRSAPANGTGEAQNEKRDVLPTSSFGLVIGPGDEVEITVYGAPDLSEHVRVGPGGNISMPLIDDVRIGGLTSSEAEGAIEQKLRQNNIVNDPHVSVYVKDYVSSGISVAGEVAKPGPYSALGPHGLFDILQAAGGLTDRASGTVTISHRGSEKDPETVQLSQDPVEMARRNIQLSPGDTVFVARAPVVYVLGEVNKPGTYVLNSTGGMTVLRLVAAAGGPTREAALGGTKMVRRNASGLQQLPVPMKDLLRGKTADIPVLGDDIIFIPTSKMKTVIATSTIVASSAASAAIYHIY